MIEVRPIEPGDEPVWRLLWRDYLAFYETELPELVYATNFARLTDPAVRDYNGLSRCATARRSGLRTTSSTATAGRSPTSATCRTST